MERGKKKTKTLLLLFEHASKNNQVDVVTVRKWLKTCKNIGDVVVKNNLLVALMRLRWGGDRPWTWTFRHSEPGTKLSPISNSYFFLR